jgi:hypothetical protein
MARPRGLADTIAWKKLASHIAVDVQEREDPAYEVWSYLEAWATVEQRQRLDAAYAELVGAKDAYQLRAKDVRLTDHLVSATNTDRGPYLPVREMGGHDGTIEIAFDQILQAVTGRQPYDDLNVNDDTWVWVVRKP